MPDRIKTYRPPGAASAAKHYERTPHRQEDKNFYSSETWRKFRRWFLAGHPLCESCKAKGKTVMAVHVHHKKTRKQRPDLAFVEDNCEALCQPCHNSKEER